MDAASYNYLNKKWELKRMEQRKEKKESKMKKQRKQKGE